MRKDTTVRLSGISISNFKNVKNGELSFNNPRKNYRASILGLYGQNGSGKTALIDALQILKSILCGKAVDSRAADYVNVDAQYATLEYIFDVTTSAGKYKAYYVCNIRKEERAIEQNLDNHDTLSEKKSRAVIFNEVLSYSYEGAEKEMRKSQLVNTDTSKVFVPSVKYESLVGRDENTRMDLLVAKRLAEQTSRSFVFSGELLKAARKHGESIEQKEEKDRGEVSGKGEEYECHMVLLESLIYYGHYELFLINTTDSGAISMNILPLAFKYDEGGRKIAGKTALSLEKPTVIPQNTVEIVEKVIKDMNIVLEQMVPGLMIRIQSLGDQAMENGATGRRIQLMSCKNSREIPLKYESEGIKKIIMILQLLITVYNQKSVTVAIDELDSGIFEYLLGEILRIVSERGEGQLIFTSHNLRPLETLDRGFVAFTTTNPTNRYVRLTNMKDNNNLRDFYYRDIVLGMNGQKEELYESTHNEEIAFAFREAGEEHGA